MKKPNVVFIFADQWRASAAGYAGDPNVKTPNIDKLYDECISFKTAVSNCPICTPARASLLTGQYPLTTGLFMNDLCLSNNAVSLADAFKSDGYNTAYIGKWHIDGHGRASFIPKNRRHGFDYWKVLECTHDYWKSHYYEGDSAELLTWEGYDAFSQTQDAIEYLNNTDKDKPFLLMISYGPPHNPYHTAPVEYRQMYKEDEIKLLPNVPEECKAIARNLLQGYYSHISALDRCVGLIEENIELLGLAEDTIFVLTSDHGDSVMSHCTLETGNINKQRAYDESILVPFLIKYPALLSYKKKEITVPFATPDIMPTLLELAGVSIPDTVEGISFAPVLLGKGSLDREGIIIASYAPFSDWCPRKGGVEYRGVRTKQYTYAKNLRGPWLLFDNYADPYQLNNVIHDKKYESVKNHLDELLKNILDEQGDEFLSAGQLCLKYGYHDIDPIDNAIPINKGEEWYINSSCCK